MTNHLDDPYLVWLYKQIAVRSVGARSPQKTHWHLLRQLYYIDFIWLVERDDNRAEDGRALRYEWADAINVKPDDAWLERGCSFLEMLVALSRRLAFEGDGHPSVWFWHLLDNIDLAECNDRSQASPETISEIVNTVIWRTYDRNGQGGLFPLRDVRQDQRTVELWYQMNAYLTAY